MSWSLGEIKALAVKAARGAGMPWGMADEAGFAVRWLQARNVPGLAALARYLDWRDGLGEPDHDLCPISLGTAIMDAQRDIPSNLGLVRQPLLLAPYLASRAPSGLALRWDDTELIISEAGLVTTASRDALLTVQAHCEAAPAAGEDGETVVRVPETEVGAVALLDKYAQRTYAPATDASRLSGAGAGTTDND